MKKINLIIFSLVLSIILFSCNNKVTISFDTDGGSIIEDKVIKKKEKLVFPSNPVKKGYDFKGWIYNNEEIKEDYLVNKNMTLKAKWEIIKYNIVYNLDEGINNENNPNSYDIESEIVLLDPTKYGYVFKGWYLDNNYNTKIIKIEKGSINDLNLYAKWEEETTSVYVVTFNSNGGSVVENINVTKNSLIKKPINPEKEEYNFVGWYKDEELTILWDFEIDVVTSNLTLYAKWEEIKDIEDNILYEHNFTEQEKNSTFLTFDEKNNPTDKYGSYKYNELDLTKAYKIDSKGEVTFILDEDNIIVVLVIAINNTIDYKINDTKYEYENNISGFAVESIVLNKGTYTIQKGSKGEFGIYFIGLYYSNPVEPKEYVTISFNTNGGNIIENKKIEKNSQLKNIIPVKQDYDFEGWYLDSNFQTKFDFNSEITEDITLYAKWVVLKEYKVIIDDVEYSIKEKSLINIIPKEIYGKVFLGYYENDILFDYLNVRVTRDITLVSKYRDAEKYTINLNLDGGSYEGQTNPSFYENEKVELNNPIKENYIFVNWYLDSNYTTLFTLEYLTNDIDLYALYKLDTQSIADLEFGSNYESMYAIFEDSNIDLVKIQYKEKNSEQYLDVDKELIRIISNNKIRVDIVGLKQGLYDLKITTSNKKVFDLNDIYVEKLDRSGYAHFNYTNGIGAYNDDGTLKKDAVVVYVTEENKDTIEIPNVSQKGIGWILNNSQYSKNGSNTYNQTQALNSISSINYPLNIRIIGKVTSPEGLTEFNSTINGGTEGDNGHMARIKNANNITIEGIGEDAMIYGWGIHFIASTNGRGIGFEVRNLTFDKYPEDALGMEGVQEGGVLTVPVLRGWIHNNTFMQGYCANPAESDKAEGDGSLDIKRGEYFTVSYNKFINAHKTNLVGSGDTSLQYNITYHHNWWFNSGSRIPLARQANIHMYNNVFEISDDNTNEISYVQNTRANAYIFSEANYFYGTKNPYLVEGGAIKAYNDILYSWYGDYKATVVTDREEKVISGNKYENFDTNPDVFYYDQVNKVSKVERLTDAITARMEVYMYSGTYYDYKDLSYDVCKVTNITPTLITSNVIVNNATKITKGTPLLVFEIENNAVFEMEANASVLPTLVDIYGKEYLRGTGSINLTPGIYILESSISHGASKGKSQAKDSGVSKYSIILN